MKEHLTKVLESEIKRFNAIIAYQDKLRIDEVSYRFYNEAEEDEATEPAPEEAPAEEPAANDMDMQEPAPEETPTEEPAPEEAPADDMSADMMPDEEMPEEEDTTEIDVTELVNSTKEIDSKLDGMVNGLNKINDIVSQINTIQKNLAKMDGIINQMTMLTKQVELMRPPTEEERIKALKKDSYPFNTSIEDYNAGLGVKNQTELENSSKMSMYDNLMKDYNEMDIKRSFNIPNENAFLKA